MASKGRDLFLTIRSEGAILPPDLLQRIVAGDRELDGLKPDDYHLPKGEKLNEATSRSWNRLLGAWASFRPAAERLPDSELGASLTRERWLLPLFQELGYGRLLAAKAIEADGKSYTISHGWNRTPIHLLGCRIDLDRSQQHTAKTSRSSPHSLLQETLNRSKEHLWGFVTNGFKFRILRNNASLTRQAFVEFDLEAMMLGENYADFVLLWLLCHQSRVEAENPNNCWLEKWSQTSKERGVRALDQLRRGVEQAIAALGRGFLICQPNRKLREDLRSGSLDPQDYYRQLLRLVYRFLFLFTAEDRGLLLVPGDEYAEARERYLAHYSTIRLRRMAERRMGTRHTDLFCSLRLVMKKLGVDDGCAELALPALGGFLFSSRSTPDLENCDIANFNLSEAFRALAITVSNGIRRPVDYKNIGAEELGSVYESLLELHPRVNLDAGYFELNVASGHERKTSGSYYTHTSLIDCLLDSALEPVLDDAARKPDPARAILGLKVVDPACGSGHFLIAAAHRIARRLATARTGDEEPSPEARRTAFRDVIGHCIYGVDVNPMAIELCKVNLWIEAIQPGKPLSFLESKIQCGNALLGTTPALLNQGIPDDAFTPLEGDSKEACTKWKKANKAERASRQKKQERFAFDAPWMNLGRLAESFFALHDVGDESIEQIRQKEILYEQAVRSGDYLDGRFLADAWCAAFVWRKASLTEFPITEDVFRQIENHPTAFSSMQRGMTDEIQSLAARYNFLHWHLAFPDVFRPASANELDENKDAGWVGGFDVVLGNPPWERIKLQEKEWFSTKSPEVMNASNASIRKAVIKTLKNDNPTLYREFLAAARDAETESHLVRNGGRFKLCAQGDLNTYSLFAELFSQLLAPSGFSGIIVPTGIATDESNSDFFGHLTEDRRLVSLFDFENRDRVLFPEVYYRMRFCLLTICGVNRKWASPTFGFFAHKVQDLAVSDRSFTLSTDDIQLINPNTKTCPIFRSKQDADIVKSIYSRVPILKTESPVGVIGSWNVQFLRQFDMTNDAKLFVSEDKFDETWALEGNVYRRSQVDYLPLYEGRMIDNYDHRLASTKLKEIKLQRSGESINLSSHEKESPTCLARPRYWVAASEVAKASLNMYEQGWVLGCMSITSATNARTSVMSVVPHAGLGNSVIGLLLNADARHQCCLLATFCSLVFDYVSRQKVSGNNFNMFIIKQLPCLPPAAFDRPAQWDTETTYLDWILPRVMELAYTAADLRKFALDAGFDCGPFRWDDNRRFLLKCELDAAFFRLFGIDRRSADHVLDSFTIVRTRDFETSGQYRTKHQILSVFDAMVRAESSGIPFQTELYPAPGDPRLADGFVAPAPSTQQHQVAEDLRSVAAGAWSMPIGVTPENLAILTLVEVMRAFGGNASQAHVRLAATLVRKPAHALAFLEDERAKEWVRVVGDDARPLPANVLHIDHFRTAATDRAWASAVTRFTGTDVLISSGDRWTVADNFPASSGEPWVAGRAAFAVDLVSKVIAADIEERMTLFLRSVEDGTARRAVS